MKIHKIKINQYKLKIIYKSISGYHDHILCIRHDFSNFILLLVMLNGISSYVYIFMLVLLILISKRPTLQIREQLINSFLVLNSKCVNHVRQSHLESFRILFEYLELLKDQELITLSNSNNFLQLELLL